MSVCVHQCVSFLVLTNKNALTDRYQETMNDKTTKRTLILRPFPADNLNYGYVETRRKLQRALASRIFDFISQHIDNGRRFF